MSENKYGRLLTPDIKIHRKYFEELVRLYGIQVTYLAPRKDKSWTNYAEIKSNYQDPIKLGCIFEEYPTPSTTKKRGWVHELQKNSSFIDVPYDTKDIQIGALFYIPSPFEGSEDRLFRCVHMRTSMVYPAAVTCEIVPEFENTYTLDDNDYKHSSFNHLNKEEGYY